MNEIIIFYHTFYEELLKNSIRHNIRHVTWVPTDSSCDATDYIKNNFPPFTASNPTICFMLPNFHTDDNPSAFIYFKHSCLSDIRPLSALYEQSFSPSL